VSILRLGLLCGVCAGVVAAWSCAGDPLSTAECMADADCPLTKVCQASKCVPKSLAMDLCTAAQTRPCGPAPVGACQQGVQRCVDGVFEMTCPGQVTPVAETCNGVDDDCDGVTDNVAGTASFADGDGDGFGDPASPQSACAPPAGAVTNSADCDDTKAAVNPAAQERCSTVGVDDNCNGMADEGCGCTTIGSSQACCSGRGTQTCEASDAGAVYSECSVLPATETCNGIDDDCDGQVDEGLSFLTTDGGTSALPDGGVVAGDGTCSAGLGACRRSATASCAQGALSCAATPGTPGLETCNGIDDDCDGQVDEGTQVTCYPDPDNDGVASNGTASLQCPDPVRPTFGNCPLGSVAAAPTEPDCAPSDPTAYRVASTRADADDDTFCVGAVMGECIGAGAAAGRRIATTCSTAGDDCNDASASVGATRVTCYPDADNDGVASSTTSSLECADPSRAASGNCPSGFVGVSPGGSPDCAPSDPATYRAVTTRADADADGYCVGSQQGLCIGVNAPSGTRIAATCQATDDCNDGAASQFTVLALRTDVDGDGYCIGTSTNTCVGATLPPGTRLTSSCNATINDCNDSASALYQSVSLRTDSDGDGYCVNAPFTQCVGASAPAATRFTSACNATDDCRDSNTAANVTCTIPAGYSTLNGTKQCGVGPPPTENVSVLGSTFCPAGFSLATNTLSAARTGGDLGGTCTAQGATTITMACGTLVFGTFTCNITGSCVAI
jgi:hypothetical protein